MQCALYYTASTFVMHAAVKMVRVCIDGIEMETLVQRNR